MFVCSHISCLSKAGRRFGGSTLLLGPLKLRGGRAFLMYTQESRRSQSPSSGLRPTQPANTPTRHLNQCQVEAEEVRVQSSSFHNIEDVLVCISAWKSWMPLYLPHFRGPLVSVASLNVTSLHSCPSSLHPASLTRTENEVQLFHISVEGTKLNPKLSSPQGKHTV